MKSKGITADLADESVSVNFYDERYRHGYMEEWPEQKKRRILDVIRELELPREGDALDFGCGSGALTQILTAALPGWRIHGSDISAVALEQAQARVPDGVFFRADDPAYAERRFDFLFTHHVLEHVGDLPRTIGEMVDRLNPKACMLHILPCGNEGSFERNLCLLHRGGIDPALGNRFFFEDEGHVRRLTTNELTAALAPHGFALVTANYSHQYHGGMDWLTEAGPAFIRHFTRTSDAIHFRARCRLWGWRVRLMAIDFLRRFVAYYVRPGTPRIVKALGAPLYLVARRVDASIRERAAVEWKTQRTRPNGSEMYLAFTRE